MKDLCIIIVNMDCQALLKKCLQSIYASTHKISFEIILVDNASCDGSQKMVKESFPGVKLIENTENLGFTKASNQGLRLCNAKYAMLLNNDTEIKDSAFDRMFDFMETHLKVGACGPKLLNVDGSIQQQGSLLGQRFWKSKDPKETNFVIGACLMVRKEVLEKVGLLDENLYFYNEDLDWCKSIRKAGYKLYYLPQAEVVHYGGYSSKRSFNRRLFVEGFKGGLYFCRKHYGLIAYLLYSLILGMAMICALAFLSLFYFRKDRSAKLSAYADIIKTCFL